MRAALLLRFAATVYAGISVGCHEDFMKRFRNTV
jgi:hypothetical protein